jgi:hypothetical protein
MQVLANFCLCEYFIQNVKEIPCLNTVVNLKRVVQTFLDKDPNKEEGWLRV